MSGWPAPDAEAQIEFLRNVQRLLAEGSFVATYKFALLHALADLALVRGDETGAPLTLRTEEISARVTELYWRQAVRHDGGSHEHVLQVGGGVEHVPQLRQNAGSRQAAIVAHITRSSAGGGTGELARLRRDARGWGRLVRDVDRVLREMPLWKLQTLGAERVEFLYEHDATESAREITLKPGVPWCLRAYHGLVTELVRGAWLRFVRRHNKQLEAGSIDLAAFLFGSGRAAVGVCRQPLFELQAGRCFYCTRPMKLEATAVDHFIPWSRYAVDLGHNFVLAHAGCNGAKSDMLAAERHLERWVRRNEECGDLLAAEVAAVGFPSDLASSRGVTRWAYAQAERARGQVWAAGDELEHLSGAWRALLVG